MNKILSFRNITRIGILLSLIALMGGYFFTPKQARFQKSAHEEEISISYSFSLTSDDEEERRYFHTSLYFSTEDPLMATPTGYGQICYQNFPIGTKISGSKTINYGSIIELDQSEILNLFHRIENSGIKNIKTDKSGSLEPPVERIVLRRGKDSFQWNFYNQDQDDTRRKIRNLIEKIVLRKIEEKEGFSPNQWVSSSDAEPPISVEFMDLIKNPNNYNGKRISVSGFLLWEFESCRLALDEDNDNRKFTIGIHSISPFANPENMWVKNESTNTVEGIFTSGVRNSGFVFSQGIGLISRVTRITPEDPRDAFNPKFNMTFKK